MQLFNVRLGLATNSSSSHSLIFLEDMEASDYRGFRHTLFRDEEVRENEPADFGWQHFTCASPEAKMQYLGVLLRDRLYMQLPENIADLVIKDWLSEDTFSTIAEGEGHIDHQSWMFLPSSFNTNIPDEKFFNELKDYFLNDKLVIMGGNDNEDHDHPLDDGNSFQLPLDYDGSWSHNCVCRKDDKHNYWTLFWPEGGAKLRFRLENGKTDWEDFPQKATAPELIDIKITDFCPFGCEYCYQSSTVNGKHCKDIWSLARTCGELNVFEVALGGGEPTLHPKFAYILEQFRKQGVVPNFTTRNLTWLHDPVEREKIMEHCGAFAVSINNEKDIENLVRIIDYSQVSHSRVNLHYVMGTENQWSLPSILKKAKKEGLRTTLLGWKNVGFAEGQEPKEYDKWLDDVKKLSDNYELGSVSIDTVLAAEFDEALQENGVSDLVYHTEDGGFSCYIDWVNNKMGPSSYEPDKMVDLTTRTLDLTDEVSTIFASF